MSVNSPQSRFSGLELLLTPTIKSMRRGVAQLLRTIAFADGAARQTPDGSAHAVERKVGWAYQDEDLNWCDSSRVRRGRCGESNLGPGPLTILCHHFSGVAGADCPLFWVSFQGQGATMRRPYAAISPSVRRIVQQSLPLPPSPGINRDPPKIDLQRLALEGSFDAVAVMWHLLDTTSDPAMRFRVGRYVPPALALLAARPTAARLIHVIFARLRQSHLDGLAYEGRQLSLATYDLTCALDELWTATGMCCWEDLRRKYPPIHERVMQEWMERHVAPLEAEGARPSLWAPGLSPVEHMLEPGMDLHERVLVPLQALLGDYWGNLPAGVMPARHEPRPPARRKALHRTSQVAVSLEVATRNGAIARGKRPRGVPKGRGAST